MSISLEKISGLPLAYEEMDKKLIFPEEIEEIIPSIRRLEDMKDVLLDRNVAHPKELYYMYRDIHRKKDEELIRGMGLRYDITIIAEGFVGREFIKTAGHYHPSVQSSSLTYPEVYEVIKGRALYLFQKVYPLDSPSPAVEDIILFEAYPGDKIIVPPNYGHITINLGNEDLVMSNWMADGLPSDYHPIKKAGGGAFFVVKDDNDFMLIPNENYKHIQPPRTLHPRGFPPFGILKERPLYLSFLEHPESFKFLSHPQDFLDQWKELYE